MKLSKNQIRRMVKDMKRAPVAEAVPVAEAAQ